MRLTSTAVAVTALLASCGPAPTHADKATAPATIADPAALVDPLVGTGANGRPAGAVDTFPGASMPFGMIQWSPDTPSHPAGGEYAYTDSSTTGFSLTHLSGAGCDIGGDIPILPLSGAVPSNPSSASASFRHASETAHPGSYAVTADGVKTRLAVTDRTGVAQFTYPSTGQGQLLFKVAGSANGGAEATFSTQGHKELTGSVTSGRFCGWPDHYTVYFAARFDRPFSHSGTWGATGDGSVDGGYVTFPTAGNPVVGMQVAISYVSITGAEDNLAAEAKTWNVGKVADQATQAWNGQLSRIGISGGTRVQEQKFYTALYHASLDPTLFNDADGRYLGFDNKVHKVAPGRNQYTDFSGWDIYRSEVPLLATIDPKIASDMATSLVNDAAQGGSLPKWPVANGYTGVMNGDAADLILADTYAFGAQSFNAQTALTDMIQGADGATPRGQGWYVERPSERLYIRDGYGAGASETLEYALADFAISRLAKALSDIEDAATFAQRSQNWAKVFDTADGTITPRYASGAFLPGTGSSRVGFQGGNAAQYTWMVPQNLEALVRGMGGHRVAAARLDTLFTRLNAGPDQPFAWQGNEPGLDTPWVYDSIGQPWKTQALVRRITSQLYSLTPDGEPGHDDLGALSSWYVWAALGVYPQTPGVPMLVLGTPQFRYAVIHGVNGPLTITARGAGDTYVKGLTVNGTATGHTWIDLGGPSRLDFTLSKTPDKAWGSATVDAPPSFGAGPVHFPPTTRAALTIGSTQVALSPGASTTVRVRVDNTRGTSSPATVSWQAALPAGSTQVSVTPARGTITVPAGGTAGATVTITAAAAATAGKVEVVFASKAANGAAIPEADLGVTVAG